jgi:Mce-associated membrane protein
MTDQNDTTPEATIPLPTPEPAPVTPPVTEPVTEPVAEALPRERRIDRKMILLGIGSGILAVVVLLLALMVFAPGIAPVKLGAVADATKTKEAEAVEVVATRFSESLYSFNYRTIDADLKAIRKDATGNFSNELEQVLGEVDVFKKAIVDAKGESTGEVQGVDVRKVSGNTATARVFVVQSIRNKKNPKSRQQVSAVELTLVKTSDGWKVDDVQQFQTGAPADAGGQ